MLVGTWWYWVSIGQYGLIYNVDWVIMKQNWVSRRQFWSVFGGAWSTWGGNGWYLVVLG